jgi:hypothetical protein
VEKIADSESKSALKGGEHQDFIGVGSWNVLTGGGVPMQHLTVREKLAHDELADLAFIGN